MSDLESYFNSYAKVAPQWEEFVEECESLGREAMPGFTPYNLNNEDGSPALVSVTEDNYPKLHGVLKEECEFRNIPIPACYVDITGELRGGQAYGAIYAIAIDSTLQELSSEKELRWIVAHELKHLYQDIQETPEEILKSEYDADRAAVESAGLDAAKSLLHKMAAVKISKYTGLSASFLDKTIPKFMTTGFPVAIDSGEINLMKFKIVKDIYHPSFPDRLKAMQEHLETLDA